MAAAEASTRLGASSSENAELKAKKAKTRRGRRVLEAYAPQEKEELKTLLTLLGGHTTQVTKDLLKDFGVMRPGETHKLSRKNPSVRPFEAGGEQLLEHLARKVDAGIFAHASTSKKRPHNLTVGRLFDGHLFDMVEVGVERYFSIHSFGNAAAHAGYGSKPCFVFLGPHFESEPQMRQLKNVLVDAFRGRKIDAVNLAGIDRAIVCTSASSSLVHFRQYAVKLKKSGSWLPYIKLIEMGPRFDMRLRRTQDAPPDVAREAYRTKSKRQPQHQKKSSQKNVHHDPTTGKVGKVYVPQQDLSSLDVARMKGSKKRKRNSSVRGGSDIDAAKAGASFGDGDDMAAKHGGRGQKKAKQQRQHLRNPAENE
jgi:ribosome production factor 2